MSYVQSSQPTTPSTLKSKGLVDEVDDVNVGDGRNVVVGCVVGRKNVMDVVGVSVNVGGNDFLKRN